MNEAIKKYPSNDSFNVRLFVTFTSLRKRLCVTFLEPYGKMLHSFSLRLKRLCSDISPFFLSLQRLTKQHMNIMVKCYLRLTYNSFYLPI